MMVNFTIVMQLLKKCLIYLHTPTLTLPIPVLLNE